MLPDNVFLQQERVCIEQKKCERKEFNRSDFFEIDDLACITLNCERRDDFCVRSFDFEKTSEIYRKNGPKK